MRFFKDLWLSFLSMPLWVRIWIFLFLIPINFASIVFIGNPYSLLIFILASMGIVFNLIPMIIYRGFTDAMAISHVLLWIPLSIILFYLLFSSDNTLNQSYRIYLLILFVTNIFSLVFDIPDSIKWLKQRKTSVKK